MDQRIIKKDKTVYDVKWSWISNDEFFSLNPIEGETWKPLSSFNNKPLSQTYQVSNKGRIRNSSGKVILGTVTWDGYHAMQLSILDGEGKCVNTTVHKIVLTVFKGLPPEDMIQPTVQHINHDKLDNRIENLCWMSAFDNNQEGHGTRCKIIDSSGEHVFESQKVASKYIGRHDDYISEGVHYGYKLTTIEGKSIDVYTEIDDQWCKYEQPVPRNKNRCKITDGDQAYEFESYQECDRFLNKTEGYTASMLLNGWPVVTKSSEQFYMYDRESNDYVLYVPTKHKTRNHSNKCKIIDIHGESTIFDSISKAARYIGKNPEYVRTNIRDSKQIFDSNGNLIQAILLDEEI